MNAKLKVYIGKKIFNKKSASRNLQRLEDTHREKVPSNKTPALTNSTSMSIWVVRTSSQLYKRFLNWDEISKYIYIYITGKTPILCDRSILYWPF